MKKIYNIILLFCCSTILFSCGYKEIEKRKDVCLIFDYTKINDYYVELVYNIVDSNHTNKTVFKLNKLVFIKDSIKMATNAFIGTDKRYVHKTSLGYEPRNNAYSGQNIKVLIKGIDDNKIIDSFSVNLDYDKVKSGYFKGYTQNSYVINPLSKSKFRIDYVPYGGKIRKMKSKYIKDKFFKTGYIKDWFRYEEPPEVDYIGGMAFERPEMILIRDRGDGVDYNEKGFEIPRIYLHR